MENEIQINSGIQEVNEITMILVQPKKASKTLRLCDSMSFGDRIPVAKRKQNGQSEHVSKRSSATGIESLPLKEISVANGERLEKQCLHLLFHLFCFSGQTIKITFRSAFTIS
jgi:hypothetical protein